jgi:hypothetical protein
MKSQNHSSVTGIPRQGGRMARQAGGTSSHVEHHERRAEEAEKALAKEREINKVLKDLLAGKAA